MNSQVLQIVQAICKEAMHLPGEVGLAVMWSYHNYAYANNKGGSLELMIDD